jgi:acyl-CoA synthetase (AMP-forming)/AMP-acid ligase II
LRYLYAGGGALDPALKQQIEAAFRLPLHHGYGMTEYAGSMFVTRIERPRQDCSPGELNPDCEVQFVATGDKVPGVTGDTVAGVGEIWVRGPGTMLGYYRAPDLTRETVTADGWLRTGDIGRLQDGALFIVGRSKDMIKRLGFAIYPLEIEAELSSHPAVRLAAVIGAPSKDTGEEDIVAFVEAQPGQQIDPLELLAYVRPRLVSYKRPAEIIPVQSMPLTANGKVRKQELRAMLAARPAHS